MGKRWMAAALTALALAGMCAAPPLAEAVKSRSREAVSAEAPPEERAVQTAALREKTGAGLTLVEIVEPAGSLTAMRAAAVTDVPAEDRDAACYAVYRRLLEPGKDGAFHAGEPVSRGEAVATLYRLSGILVRVDGRRYGDVPEEYQDAVAWAASVGVSGGVSEDRFAPFSPVTRSQLAAMLYRFAAWRGEDMACKLAVSVPDEDVPAYAEEALNWVLDRGFTPA